MGKVQYVGNQPDLGAPIWRYMDLYKFISMLSASALHFSRADRLGDEWEGSINAATVAGTRQRILAKPSNADSTDAEIEEQLILWLEAENKSHLGLSYVSCWHRADSESSLMWGSYGNRGIAVQTTIGALSSSLTSSRFHVMASDIEYVDDYTRSDLDLSSNTLDALLHKRSHFRSEQEYRFVAVDEEMLVAMNAAGELGVRPPVLTVPVNMHTLTKAVVLAPRTEPWVIDVVKDLVTKFGLPGSLVQRSGLDELPMIR